MDRRALFAHQNGMLVEVPYRTLSKSPLLIYDQQRQVPVIAGGEWSEHDFDRQQAVDLRILEQFRVAPSEYLERPYMPLSMLPDEPRMSCTIPARPHAAARYFEIDEKIGQLSESCWTLQGPFFGPGRKVVRLNEDSGPHIPHVIWRVILSAGQCWAFWIPNNDRNLSSIESLEVSPASIQNKAGITLWPELRDSTFRSSLRTKAKRWW